MSQMNRIGGTTLGLLGVCWEFQGAIEFGVHRPLDSAN
jgi:hypothetical protein